MTAGRTAPAATAGPADDCDESDFAERTIVGWHVLFAVMVATTAVLLSLDGHAAIALPLLLVLVVAYAVLGVPGGRANDIRRTLAYLLIAYTVLVVLTWVDPLALVLLFTIYPQAFLLLDRRGSIIATVAVTVAWNAVLLVQQGFTAAAWGERGLTTVGNIVFALVIGLFIDGLVRESAERKRLLAELHAAQAELAQAERAAGVLAERERLAGEIHDTLAQGFTSIVVLAQAGAAAAERADDPDGAEALARIEATARENLAEARALVGALTPPGLGRDGLTDAVGRQASRFEGETGIPVHLAVEGQPEALSQASCVALLRATQEALANVRQHAGAAHVSILLRYDEDGATVDVRDDGRGFDPAEARAGYGLDGIVARAEGVGGLARVQSAPGEGTTVRVRVP